MVQDPWSIHDSNYSSSSATPSPNSDVPNEPSHLLSFEDNFHPSSSAVLLTTTNTKLPDTEEYLQSLERKLLKLRGGCNNNNNNNVLNQLAARREQCLEHLLNGHIQLPSDEEFGLLSTLSPSSNTVDQLHLTGANLVLRRIQPEQPVNPGELVHIIKYDQLDQQQQQQQQAQQLPATETVQQSLIN